MTQTWNKEYSTEVNAPTETIWRIFCDVAHWKTWNNGIEEVALEGPFASGTWFTMKPPGQEAMRSQLVEVIENQSFVDKTQLGDITVWVAHRLEKLDAHRTRVTYTVNVQGPGASEVGQAISADFPDVLAALATQSLLQVQS